MLSLYIHIPFCVRKCRYCGFYSTAYSPGRADEFIAGFIHEAARYRYDFSHRTFSSIYMGGGTPTVLSPDQLGLLVRVIRDQFPIDDRVEFTVEANPSTVTSEKLSLLLAQGVNRLSLGVQSFSDEILQTLGRLHTGEQAADAFRLARSTGFKNIGVDLIYGIPGQTATRWEETLDAAIALKPEHLSAYSLSLDDGSQLMRDAEAGGFTMPDDEVTAAMYEYAVPKLSKAGYAQYEISNFSLPGYECRHNMNYWDRGEYLGLGPGAWSFISGRRYANISDTGEYSKRLSDGRSVIDTEETIGPIPSARETILLGLRTMKGLDLLRFEREYGADLLLRLERNVVPLRDAGLVRVTEGRLTLTGRGILLSNAALARLSV
ncbi:MAG: radical SAM family heme chaperone HemW [Nitrospirae bacterium]|nr:radical SAM family heme chaperone HemW [Nitrospirota bacterium]